jgi:hypothetical protein
MLPITTLSFAAIPGAIPFGLASFAVLDILAAGALFATLVTVVAAVRRRFASAASPSQPGAVGARFAGPAAGRIASNHGPRPAAFHPPAAA